MKTHNQYEVVGVPMIGTGEAVLRRFDLEDDAISHALNVDMGVWDDVYVRPIKKIVKREITAPPSFPWTVEWTSSFAYVKDADGNKIASLLGPQKQREFMADILCDLK